MNSDLRRLHEACPLAALAANGFGPLGGWLPATEIVDDLIGHPAFRRVALETLGAAGHAVLEILDYHDGSLTPEQWAFETAVADVDDLAATVDRLQALQFLTFDADGQVRGVTVEPEWSGGVAFSYTDPFAMNSDQLADVLRYWNLEIPRRKSERVAALAAHFATGTSVISSLSAEARALFDDVADAGGLRAVDVVSLGIEPIQLYFVSRRVHGGSSPAGTPELVHEGLAEVVDAGLVGFDRDEAVVWIWREAWPVAGRPLIRTWPAADPPALVARHTPAVRVGEVATALARVLDHWREHPPRVLKNNSARLAKADLRSTGRELGVNEAAIDLAGRLLIDLELLLPNVVAASGRGRNRRVDEVWMADPDVLEAWNDLGVVDQWLLLIDRWMTLGDNERLIVARQLVLHELLALPVEMAWSDRRLVAVWLEHRYAPVADTDEFRAALDELAALGLIETDVVAMTALGRMALLDPAAARSSDLGEADAFIVQPDFTVIEPPDLAPDVVAELSSYAVVESTAGAHIYRLDEALITRAIQRGTEVEKVIHFLESASSVELPEVVERFVNDAARRADRFGLHSAATVLVTSDPVDLADAVAVKAAKLTRIADTVAMSTLAPDKVRAALGKRRIQANIVGAADERPAAKRSAERADAVAARAAQLAEHAERSGHEYFRAHVAQLERQAERLRNPSSRFRVPEQPLTLDPAFLGRVPDPPDLDPPRSG